jgi:DNA-binding NtrC family response regulator
LGSDAAKRSDARFVFTTNHDIEVLVEAGQFRKDLYYRLRTHHVHIPPLRDHLDDLPLLLDHFLGKAAKDLGKSKPTPPRELITLLRTYDFPGNIRELESMVFDAVSVHKSRMLSMDVFKSHIPSSIDVGPTTQRQEQKENAPFIIIDEFPTLNGATQYLIAEAVSRAHGNLGVAARLLGISRQALSKRLKRANTKNSPC